MRIAPILLALAACGSPAAPALPDALADCGSDKTVTDGELYSCTIANVAGVCVAENLGQIHCRPACTPQLECALGSPYVLVVAGGDRVCYCSDETSL